MTGVELAALGIQAAPYIVMAAVGLWGWIMGRRAKDAKAEAAAKALALDGLIGVVECAPANPWTKALKAASRTVAQITGVEDSVVAPAVERVSALLKSQGLGTPADELAQADRAARAIKLADEIQAGKNPELALPRTIPMLIVGLWLAALLAGCGPIRQTHETVIGGAVAVEWPARVSARGVTTVEVDGFAVSVARPVRIMEDLAATTATIIPRR